jgi:intracellular septation protein
MQPLYDLLPVAAFFVVYHYAGIYAATAVMIPVTALQVAVQWYRKRTVSRMLLITAGLVFLFGGATLILHDDRFIVIKPTVLYGLFGTVLLLSQWLAKKPLIQQLLEAQLVTDARTWRICNLSWALFFFALAAVNLLIAYRFSRDAWANWFLLKWLAFGAFAVLEGLWLARHSTLVEDEPKGSLP